MANVLCGNLYSSDSLRFMEVLIKMIERKWARNVVPLGLLFCGWGLYGLEWNKTPILLISLVFPFVLNALISDFSFFGSPKVGYISQFLVSVWSFVLFSRWAGPILPIDVFGAFAVGISVAMGWARFYILLTKGEC